MSKIVKSEKSLSTREKKMVHNFESASKAFGRLQASMKDYFSKKKASPLKTETKEIEKTPKIKAEDFALLGLKIIGRPCRVQEIASRLMTAKLPTEYKAALPNKKKLTQILYNAVSNLVKSGELKRKAFDQKTFEYKIA
jgi:hypothetical protein